MCVRPVDHSSLANLDEVTTTHLHLDWTICFTKKVFDGSVTLDLLTLKDNVTKVVLDASYLDIKKVLYLNDQELKFKVGERRGALGSPVTIDLPEPFANSTSFQIKIVYTTTPECTAVQYLTPEQTLGGKHPFLFSQCEAIHARSFVPCQDSPAVKLTYSANVTSPLPVVMSALDRGSRREPTGGVTYTFHQPIKIPTYLICIASGNIASRELSDRCKVLAEPEMVDAVAWEFEDTDKFLSTAEGVLTPYEWHRYDILILPPSYPYGGMENPCLTFATPTLIAGDRSSINVVIHEISHSWMGNLVTTKTWEHFWLNEGHTKFIERKVLGRLYGQPTADLDAIIGLKALRESINQYGENSPATVLQPDLSGGGDPDDFFSSVPYEKGFNMLHFVEETVGGPAIFEPFVTSYVQEFAGKSITTQDWKDYLYRYMEEHHGQDVINRLNTIDFDAWIHQPGHLPVAPSFDTSLADASYALADRWNAARHQADFSAFSPKDVDGFTTAQLVVHLERISDQEAYPYEALAAMDQLYGWSQRKSPEIKFRWQMVTLKASYEPIYPAVVSFVTEQGRMKYVRPLYRSLAKAKGDGQALARSTYLAHRSFYHPICAQLLAKDLGLA
ncbi:hypothetical protein DM01DRAFT_1320836 [Hesseltinella vesiculosa]|uniref:Peptidase M1 leukotriene A4 hydrolase/aminopeptidase C-terminal domain-containing protein n=1 Tax=Hesseltinella vesiculosa TaxID=101127 RepID=A0A1X2GJR9_9FUNG|nr:hypothetical protein DM01DRAFT_1320836 [Hesseltinella vesiculosa]